MATAQRLEATMARLDSVLDQRVRREEAELAAESIEREAARRQRQRDNADQRRAITETYADAYASRHRSPCASRRRSAVSISPSPVQSARSQAANQPHKGGSQGIGLQHKSRLGDLRSSIALRV